MFTIIHNSLTLLIRRSQVQVGMGSHVGQEVIFDPCLAIIICSIQFWGDRALCGIYTSDPQ